MVHKKRLVIACDGTWLNVDSDWSGSSWFPWKNKRVSRDDPSNITRICRALLRESNDEVLQICYYQAGVGTEGSTILHMLRGLTGKGVSENIREAYSFIANNWQRGDEIVLLGFSRGAFTARSIAGLIDAVGVLTQIGMIDFLLIFKDWENQLDPDYEMQWPPEWPEETKRPRFGEPSYIAELEKRKVTNLNVPIKAVGVWDTVGALGIPDIGLFKLRGHFGGDWKEFTFANTEVPTNVEYAFQALALDEHRKPYSPTVWEKPRNTTNHSLKKLTQCWFPGVHSNIGGSYRDTGVADISLAWMISQLQSHKILTFDPAYCTEQHRRNVKYYRWLNPSRPPRPWSLGKIYQSMTLLFRLAGSVVRSPGRYTRPDPRTSEPTRVRLVDTEETVHPSVRIRRELGGPGPDDKGKYRPRALEGWECLPPGKPAPKGSKVMVEGGYKWVSEREGDVVVLPEAKLGEAELELLRLSPEVYERYVDSLRVK